MPPVVRDVLEGQVVIQGGEAVTPEELHELLERSSSVMNATPPPEKGDARRRVGGLKVSDVTIDGPLDLRRVNFDGAIMMANVTFTGVLDFYRSEFQRSVTIEDCRFKRRVRLTKASFHLATEFRDCTFEGSLDASRLEFPRHDLSNFLIAFSKVEGYANFGHTRSAPMMQFQTVHFKGDVGTTELSAGDISFVECNFDSTRRLGPMKCTNEVRLDDSEFSHRVHIDIATRYLIAERAAFDKGVSLSLVGSPTVELQDVGGCFVSLAGASLGAVSTLIGRPDENRRNPTLYSLENAESGELSVSGVDLRWCLFSGMSNLERLRIGESLRDGAAIFSLRPKSALLGHERLAIEAENRHHILTHTQKAEKSWFSWSPRAKYHRWVARKWSHAGRLPPWIASEREALSDENDHKIADSYRALRKGYEDSKNEPAAADFYYGEMEARRRATSPWKFWKPDGVLLRLYWLSSGYGTVTWRALAAYFALVSGVAAGWWFGELYQETPPPPVGYLDSFLLALSTSTSLLTGRAAVAFTTEGEVLRLILRFLGPVLLALVFLSVRSRTKR